MAKRKKLPATLSDQLCERIRHWTEEYQCSLYELATKAGIDRSVLCGFIARGRNINLATPVRQVHAEPGPGSSGPRLHAQPASRAAGIATCAREGLIVKNS
jgi:hypothetical protein